jgi:DNA processing protein
MTYLHVDYLHKYPQINALNDLSKPPVDLYIRGKWNPDLFANCVAVVGSRRMTDYGRQVIEKLVPQLVVQGKTIISGFMYGVDQYAHRICAECGGKTIAVLGWGISIPLEETEEKLAHAIINSGGLLLSEWETQVSTLWTFPVRNRIVAALSSDVYVIEAALKSGSLLTAELAYKLKRNVWAVPGPITSRVSQGTNQLITLKKAMPWNGDLEPSVIKVDDPLLIELNDEPQTANELARKLQLPVSQVGAQLSLLTVTDQITEREGKYYIH